jgi:methionyl-tRNA synthetase
MSSPPSRRILMTTALPYANAPLHLGHLLEHIQSNIWHRVMKQRGHLCLHVCGSDAHGTAIMLKAKEKNMTAEELITIQSQEHQECLAHFDIHFDYFHTTHSPENQELVNHIYAELCSKNLIEKRDIAQAYDTHEKIFLPDRYVKGDCPQCHSSDQYGDSCEQCGATYTPLMLKNPLSVISNSPPIEKKSRHCFFNFGHYTEELQHWLQEATLQKEVRHKMQEWFVQGLQAWDIARDAPYFGFPIPDCPTHYFYVWMDAPVGYLSSFKKLCTTQATALEGLSFADFTDPVRSQEQGTELYHFIGKDIMYFHTLFWPAMLMGANYRTPTGVFAHGYLTLEQKKMSKSRGTFISAAQYLEHYPSDALRYYLAAKLNSSIDDLDFSQDDFITRVNADIVGKLVNIPSRCMPFLQKHFDLRVIAERPQKDHEIYTAFLQEHERIFHYFEERDTQKAIRAIMALADTANRYIDQEKPWVLIKDGHPDSRLRAHQVCSLSIDLFRILITFLSPVLIKTAEMSRAFLNVDTLSLSDLSHPLKEHTLNPYRPLFQRLIKKDSFYMRDTAPSPNNTPPPPKTPFKDTITIDDFSKVDLRIAKIIAAEAIPEADKLLKLRVDLGNGEERTIFAGIKSAYTPEQLIGKLTAVVANLAPRKMRFGLSEGMLLAAGPGGTELFLVSPDAGAEPGMALK